MKLLLLTAILINHGDDRGGVDYPEGEIVDVNKDTAITLTTNSRALYTDKKDDPTKEGRYTADPEMVKLAVAAAEQRAKAAAKAEK